MSLHSLLGWEPGNLGAGLTATAGLCRTGSKNLAWTKPFITAFSSKEISRRFQLKILRKEVLVLWGFPSRKMHLPASHYNLPEKLLLIAWKCIVQNWIKDSRPNVILCYRDHFNTKKKTCFNLSTCFKSHDNYMSCMYKVTPQYLCPNWQSSGED